MLGRHLSLNSRHLFLPGSRLFAASPRRRPSHRARWEHQLAGSASSRWSYLDQRAFAAFLADIFLCLSESLAALALPPLRPPSLPKATAAGFFPSSGSEVGS